MILNRGDAGHFQGCHPTPPPRSTCPIAPLCFQETWNGARLGISCSNSGGQNTAVFGPRLVLASLSFPVTGQSCVSQGRSSQLGEFGPFSPTHWERQEALLWEVFPKGNLQPGLAMRLWNMVWSCTALARPFPGQGSSHPAKTPLSCRKNLPSPCFTRLSVSFYFPTHAPSPFLLYAVNEQCPPS